MRKTAFFLASVLFVLARAQAQIPPVWTPHGIGGGGSLFSPSFSPNNAGEAYMGCDMGELFHTTDLGISWEVVPFSEIRGGNYTAVQFTNDPQVMYCLHSNGNGYTPYKTTNGGAAWDSLSGDPTGADAATMAADVQNSQRVIVTNYSDLWLSTNGGVSFGASKYHSTAGGGCYVAGAFFDSANIYVGTNMGLLVSTDGGSAFSLRALTGIPAGQGLLSFAGAKQGGVTRFVATTADTGDLYVGLPPSDYWDLCQGVYTFDVGGANWLLKTNGLNLASDFVFFSAMARNNITTAYLAGGSSSGNPEIFKTTNAGDNWIQVFQTANNQNIYTGYCGYQGDYTWGWAECPMGFAAAPYDPNKIMITDFGFAHLTTDGGTMWRQAYVTPATQNPPGAPTPRNRPYQSNGLENTSCWWLTWSDSSRIFASYTDVRGIRSTDGGTAWSFNYTGHTQNTMYQAVKHPNGTLYAATSTIHDLYQSTYLQDTRIDPGTGRALFSTDNGANWQTLHDFGHPVIWLALDPRHSNRMYASSVHSTQGGIFVSNDIQNGSGSTWTKLTNPPRTEGHPFNIVVLRDSTLVCTYSGRRNSSGTFTASSGVFASTDNGASWADRSDNGMRYWTKDLVVDPYDTTQNTWCVGVFSGWGGPPNGLGGLYRTTNRGVSWTKINNLDRVESCTFSPTNSNHGYLTTEENGLWFSANIRSGNPTFTFVASYPFAHPVRVFYSPYNPNEIWVASFGNGIRMGNTGTGVVSLGDGNSSPERVDVYPNPSRGLVSLSIKGSQAVIGNIEVYDLLGRRIMTLNGLKNNSLNLSKLANGVYFLRFATSHRTYSKKIVLKR